MLGKSPTETNQLLSEAYGTQTLSRTRVFEWHKRFRDGRQEVEDEVRDGRPTTATSPEMIEAIQDTIAGDQRLSVKQVAATVGISKSSVLRILHEDRFMSKVCAQSVTRLLTPEMRQRRIAFCQELLDRRYYEELDFLKQIVTGDKTWLYFYDPKN